MSNEEKLRATLETVLAELVTLNPRLAGQFKANNEALIAYVKKALDETSHEV